MAETVKTSDLRIKDCYPLISPSKLKQEFPMTDASIRTVVESRHVIDNIIGKTDKRLLAVVGPCSIHDVKAAYEYAERLTALRKKIEDRIYVIMRVYFEKPRTTLGWRGLIMDPYLDSSYDIETGLKMARKLLVDITSLGLPAGSEMLEPIVPQYIDDLVSWAAIGARTTESQTHREMASGLSMAVGFKNNTNGSLTAAVDAMKSARHPHCFIGIDQNGNASVLSTTGNDKVHLILRGGRYAPNYYEESVEAAEALLKESGMDPAILIDCSHANSRKKYERQVRVLHAVLEERERHSDSIIGFMIESNLFAGSQEIPEDLSTLAYGVSITDGCVDFATTEEMLLSAYKSAKI
ncbi:MAG TPA: 3-deoxy-7-phosphoheptulonate synthase [Spirochaetia bacterium]|nr:3-deoxy-7-phosphoheptulonate synthase [Spirochaetia bacterium]